MGSSQQFSLRWNNYLKHITCAFDTLRTDEDLVDVTLSCEGKRIRAHKMLLSACSTYFRDLFKENPCQHPVVIFRNVKFDDLAALVDFMYQGEVNVVQEQLASFLTTAELLAVQGLTDGSGKDNDSLVEDDIEIPNEPEVQLQNASGRITTNNKGSKSPASPVELQSEPPPTKKRKCRENSNIDKGTKNSEKADSQKGVSEPVEIIPLMPNLKLEMPEYLEQDGSSCSYDDQSAGDSNKLGIDDNPSDNQDNDQKPDISQTFYSNQSTSDSLDGKQAELGHLLSKPSTSGERLAQESAQDSQCVQPIGNQLVVRPLQTTYEIRRRSRPRHDENGRWICDTCGKTYSRGDSLAHHRSIHRGDTVCPICHAVFTRKYTMRCHMVNVHGIK
ncbi:broad-complex core protein isoforms 1/2/3/4/5-like isoform X3 [Leptopilina boulardi]|uniref:broad-complex core protein isoforms 1/2/3/4/5-like isoform X3 n=1 Tax=Leptopilina boulardi TaxID=63433 RepID=UPI0021F54E17|nr:broad-complex core protein isoforms 1/2/3/4/5-like isoform X3 [Leptopilina boulardi]